MDQILRPLFTCLGIFGFVGFTSALMCGLLYDAFDSDDPYVMGWAVSCLFIPSPILYYVFSHFQVTRKFDSVAWFVYLLLASIYLIDVYFNSELDGPAIAMMIFIPIWFFGLLLFFLRKQLSKTPIIILGNILNFVFLSFLVYFYSC